VGEDLRWSTPETSTPADILQMWLNSPKHRMYLLKPKFGEVRLPENEMTDCFPHLAGSSVAVRGGCLARHTPRLYFGFAVPDRTGGQIKESAARSRYGLGPREVCVPCP
jgi:hypothetical protein